VIVMRQRRPLPRASLVAWGQHAGQQQRCVDRLGVLRSQDRGADPTGGDVNGDRQLWSAGEPVIEDDQHVQLVVSISTYSPGLAANVRVNVPDVGSPLIGGGG
jgi:hypothetical protein